MRKIIKLIGNGNIIKNKGEYSESFRFKNEFPTRNTKNKVTKNVEVIFFKTPSTLKKPITYNITPETALQK